MSKSAVAYICNNLDFQDNFTQRKLITKYAKTRDYFIEEWFEDEVSEEMKMSPSRPAYLKLLNWIKNNGGKTIITVGIGRFTLDLDKFIELQKIFKNYNIKTDHIYCELSLNETEIHLLSSVEKTISVGNIIDSESKKI